jgi:hypothetical protein
MIRNVKFEDHKLAKVARRLQQISSPLLNGLFVAEVAAHVSTDNSWTAARKLVFCYLPSVGNARSSMWVALLPISSHCFQSACVKATQMDLHKHLATVSRFFCSSPRHSGSIVSNHGYCPNSISEIKGARTKPRFRHLTRSALESYHSTSNKQW